MVGIQLVEGMVHWRARLKRLHTMRGFPRQATQMSSSQEEF